MSRPYWWFQGASVKQLRAELDAAGDSARFEVHLDGMNMTLHVIPEVQVESHEGINDSHACPPSCP